MRYYALVIFSALIHFDRKSVLDDGYFTRSKHTNSRTKSILAFTLFLSLSVFVMLFRVCLFFHRAIQFIFCMYLTIYFYFFSLFSLSYLFQPYFGSFLNLIPSLHGMNEIVANITSRQARPEIYHDQIALEHFIAEMLKHLSLSLFLFRTTMR